ncbi:hypothetical protein E2C01_009419 [Portunus trituberculatus]|uniref:Uncharacterized protein n=1 Tax=Portunus trituberculatus TaxID=210409 RepID=A0A5B7D4J5_PORTR|nr:hypothetical protein [Portunus trituberculatus]
MGQCPLLGFEALCHSGRRAGLIFCGMFVLSSPRKVNFPDILMKENALAVKKPDQPPRVFALTRNNHGKAHLALGAFVTIKTLINCS